MLAKVGGSYGTGVVTSSDTATFDSTTWAEPGPAGRSFSQIQFNARGDLYQVGSDNPMRGDVWRSLRDDCCSFWELQGYLPAPRGAGSLLFMSGSATSNAQDKLVYLGGISSTGATNDVYGSVDGGKQWATMVQAPWHVRWNHNAEVSRSLHHSRLPRARRRRGSFRSL